MNDATDKQTKFINVDLEQWQRDINAFSAATKSALDSIIGDLSAACNGHPERSSAIDNHVQKSAKPRRVAKQSQSSVVPALPRVSRTGNNVSAFNEGGRLASVKERLARQVKKK